jgi:predicted SnoaL-like aldol condensation-catalyzing enzyme
VTVQFKDILQYGHVELAEKVMAPGYIQHNPNVPTGRAAFVEFFSKIRKPEPIRPEWKDKPALTIVSGPYVFMMFKRAAKNPDDPTKTYPAYWFDMVRVDDGMIQEHWDAAIKNPLPAAPGATQQPAAGQAAAPADQASATQGGRAGGAGFFAFTEPSPLDFGDHEGYVPLFDGVSLKGWDGNPKFWRVENGAIVGESTPANPSGNSYLVYRALEAKDFTLKFEIKIEGDGGSGIQYRSKTGLPWLAPIPANVTANVGPANLNWMMTGPQADFWPSQVYTGQFYSENTPMRILAWRGQVVEGFGLASKKLMGAIADRQALGALVHLNDWNQYTVIARGGTFLHILNGQLMAVMIDDDPASSNNQPGMFGIEIEATTKVSVRNMWVKKLN